MARSQLWMLLLFLLLEPSPCITTSHWTFPRPKAEDCECGVPNRNQKIVGGEPTTRNEYPWMVSLHRTILLALLGSKSSFFCGGTLVSTDYVLTAAHCADPFKSMPFLITANFGDHDLTSSRESFGTQRAISRVEVHPDYSPMTLDNDVSLLKMMTPVQYTGHVRPVCLPQPQLDLTGQTVTASGWGAMAEGDASSSVLRDVSVPVVSHPECQAAYANVSVRITSRMLCAGLSEGGKDSCQGDSGGPLLYDCGHGLAVVGVVSFGLGCARPGKPGVYARVSEFLPWIRSVASFEGCARECGEIRSTVSEPSSSPSAQPSTSTF